MKNIHFKILVASGVNLDLLGQREPKIYGSRTYKDLCDYLKNEVQKLSQFLGLSVELEIFQSNCESEFLNKLREPRDGIILNSGAWTHTSLALADSLIGKQTPFVEVHLTNLYAREKFRQKSFTAPYALGVICGLGFESYSSGLFALLQKLKNEIPE